MTGSVVVTSSDATSVGDKLEYFCKIIAAAPATCGAAKLVPLVILYFPPRVVEFTKTPGATRSGFM